MSCGCSWPHSHTARCGCSEGTACIDGPKRHILWKWTFHRWSVAFSFSELIQFFAWFGYFATSIIYLSCLIFLWSVNDSLVASFVYSSVKEFQPWLVIDAMKTPTYYGGELTHTQRNTSRVLIHPANPIRHVWRINFICVSFIIFHQQLTTKFLKRQVVLILIWSEWENIRRQMETPRKISHVLMQSHLGTIHLTKPHWEGFRFYAGDVKNEPI